jgi:hypothetical protein
MLEEADAEAFRRTWLARDSLPIAEPMCYYAQAHAADCRIVECANGAVSAWKTEAEAELARTQCTD